MGLTPFSQHQPASASPSLLCPHIVPGRSSSRLQATAMKDGALGVKGEEQRVDPASVAESLW